MSSNSFNRTLTNKRFSIDMPVQRQLDQVRTGRASSYLSSCVTTSANITSRSRLRCTSSRCYERLRTRLKFGERSRTGFKGGQTGQLPRASTTNGASTKTVKKIIT